MTEISGEYLTFSWLAFFLPFFRQWQLHRSGRASPPLAIDRPGIWPSLTNHSCLGRCLGIRILTKAGILPWNAKHKGWVRGSLSFRDLHTWSGLHTWSCLLPYLYPPLSCGENQSITGEDETDHRNRTRTETSGKLPESLTSTPTMDFQVTWSNICFS